MLSPRFERNQYLDFRRSMEASQGDLAGKSVGDIYGAEHLCRLLGNWYNPHLPIITDLRQFPFQS